MKLLFLAPYPPYPPRGGGQQRIYQFIQHTARAHEVWLLTFSPSPAATAALAPLGDLCRIVTVPTPAHTPARRLRTLLGSTLPDMALRGRSAAFGRALADLLGRVPFDVIQAESIEMVQYAARRPDGPLAVYDAFNAEFLLQRRAFWTDLQTPRKLPAAVYSLIQWRKLRRYETRLGRHVAGALAVSDADAAVLRGLAPALPVGVVPNGVDTAFFSSQASAPPDPEIAGLAPYILFTGTLDFRPNIDAVTWFVREVLPLVRAAQPDARFVVVGRNPAPAVQDCAAQPGVRIVGEVADVRPWFVGAAAYAVPMRIGGGVRLKVLEALAMERPVVATTMGAEGIAGLRADEHALLADDPPAFAAQLLRVLADGAPARRLGAAGRALVTARYDWRAIVPPMVELWHGWRAAG